ncbi:hypothetical protein [Brucella intermedia]|uniref:hypothetical protein n=1 Tax=Brucella intermedia TaxID=94625 RepID=UPI0022495A10|nr:hypothetical protein [Brucella intermedia]
MATEQVGRFDARASRDLRPVAALIERMKQIFAAEVADFRSSIARISIPFDWHN